ncbi:MAG: hypothetical protein Tsb0034_30860 [Ekhidna sp.]
MFRKDFLQLSGGISEAEINSFANIVQGFTSRLEQDYIGGRAFNTGKETSESVEFIDVSDRVNQGVGYVTFFGHSSGTVTDIEIGRVSDPQFGFSNKGKYPVFLVNGCRAGEIFGSNFTFGEDWTLTPNLGAVSFMAHTSSAVASTLRNWSNLYYEIGFGDEYIGSTVGEVIVEVSRQYFDTYGSSDLNLTQVQQMLLQGDPAYKLFGATAPDYQVTNESVYAESIEVGEILATQDSFKVNIITKNFGRTVDDPLIVEIARIYPNGSQTSYLKEFERVLRNDTLVFYIPLEPTSVNEGSNILTIKLDPQNMVAELDESNNLATLEVSILSGNTIHLFPIDNGIEATDEIEFVWQSSNLLEEERTYELEFDTRADFNGPNSRSVEVSGAVLMRHSFDFSTFSLPDSTVVYWRTRYAEPSQGESNEWVESSFTIVSNAAYGWAQYEPDQIAELLVSGVNYNDDSKKWAFIQTTNPIEIFTFGADNTDLDSADFRAIINGINFAVTSNTIDPLCFDNTFNAIAFDRESGDPYRPIETEEIDVFNDEVCGRLPQRIYQFEEEDMIGASRRFEVLVDNMRDGDMIVMFNIGYVAYSNWDAEVIGTLNSLGVNTATIQSLTDGQPVIFFGRNGDAPGSASEVVSNGSAEPIGEQIITLEDEAFGSFTSGQIRSPRVGPAKDWESFSFRFSEEVNDQYNLEVYGISPDGSSSSLVQRGRVETIDVSAVDPVLYPELELVLDFDDETDQTPLQFDYWQVGYSKPPEGLITITSKEIKEVQEGEEVSKAYGFVNISTIDFTDSLTVMARMINQETGRVEAQSFRIGPPLAGDTTTFEVTFSTFDMPGANSLVVEVMPNENEAYSINNRLTFANAVDVNPDETNPVLDVTFDGFHILNGDVVSPDPLISIVMRDDNPFISKSDTVGINLSLKLPGETSQFERVNFSDPRLVFTPASESQDFEIAYSPGPLEDGIYALRIQAEDESGNQAGADPYEISFEVINASTITHFYPYPNPFSTSCRFVFTLTGSEIPDEIKIQIMTVSGRVVREITQDEIGPVRIGNNITSYAWDGRDEFGDELANGVYFYKVFTNTNGNALERRATAGDRAFKHGFGKLYILR